MFDTRKFGGYLSRLRKNADMTQSELADKLYLTRQAVSQYELGNSFPDVSILVLIADIFNITTDELIASGEPTRGESVILGNVARGKIDNATGDISDIVNLAPLLKPSILAKLSLDFSKHGIDISSVVALSEYLNGESVVELLERTSVESLDSKLLEKFLPMLDDKSKETVFRKILDGEIDWHFIQIFLPYADHMLSQIEAAVVEGALPEEVLKFTHEYSWGNL